MITPPYTRATLLAFLAMMAGSTDAAYRMYLQPSKPMSRALSARMIQTMSRQAFFPRDVGRIMQDFDELFDSVLGRFDEFYYEPTGMSRLASRPSYLLHARPEKGALALRETKKAMEITQNDHELHIVLNIPGANASDINLQLEQDDRILRVFGETTREDDGIAVKSSFHRTFVLDRNIDASNITAKMVDEVLTITAPKTLKEKKEVRTIDIVEEKVEQEKEVVASGVDDVKEESAGVNHLMEKTPAEENENLKDNSVIDLDLQKE